MRLSEAIRLGAMMKPQAFGPSSRQGTCAFNAALEAIGQYPSVACVGRCAEIFGVEFLDSNVICPQCGTGSSLARIIAVHLNDDHLWTRERIADWVETIEKQQESSQPLQVEEKAHA